ncbi:putative prolyl 4-hydroxylase 3 [Gossypium australe]|uniref:Putative prolyl 4-hydroxylase 3 n=1 Tax=Gossypium australe TaxID=47621 RepID=A0A5B6WFW9_9ROSI|nr:putative prolyl 4-hydroxylase 3 [Gossypium australe]
MTVLLKREILSSSENVGSSRTINKRRLGIFSLPINDDDSPPNDLTSYRCMASERGKGMGKRGEQWTEVLS